MSWRVSPSSARSARISPTTEQNLKPWPEKPAPTTASSRLRVAVDQEVLVRGGLEEARLERDRRPGAVGEVALGERAERRLVLERRLARDRVRVAARALVVVAAELEARDAEGGEAVEVLPVEDEVEDREAGRARRARVAAAGATRAPAACAHDEPGGSRATSCDQAPAVSTSRSASTTPRSVRTRTPFSPSSHSSTRSRVRRPRRARARRRRARRCSARGAGSRRPAGRRPASSGGSRYAGNRRATSAPVEHLVREVVIGARAEDALEDPRPAFEDSGDVEELLAGLGLELAPELVRAAEQRHVARSARSRRGG